MAGEPELRLGESGDWVRHLQERLQALGYYDDYADGDFDDAVAEAVTRFHEAAGIYVSSGDEIVVTEQTWQALEYQEQQQSAAVGAGYDAGQDDQSPQLEVGALSDDGSWQWDGVEWQPVEQAASNQAGADSAQTAEPDRTADVGVISDDGQWRWDGAAWQPVEGAAAEDSAPPADAESSSGTAAADGEAASVEQARVVAVNHATDDPTTEEAALVG